MPVSNALVAALLSTSLISLAPNLILLIFPNYGTGEGANNSHSRHFLSLGQAMAAGGLLGDVFLHTLPHTQNNMEDAGLWILAGFTLFLVADMLIRSMDSSHGHSHGSHSHGQNDHSSPDKKEGSDNTKDASNEFRISPTILLNLAGDAMHNFTDGLAIGASFSIQSAATIQDDASLLSLLSSRGGLATLSILLHELPHELGDFATLVKAGCSKKQAILLQFVTAVAALIGTVMGVYAVEESNGGGEHLLHITGGGFIYLAAVTILPEVLNEATSLRFRFAQLGCFCTGVAFLYAVAMIEHAAAGGHGGHSHSHHEHHHKAHHMEHDHHDHHQEEVHNDHHQHDSHDDHHTEL